MRFASLVFRIAGWYGLVVMVPLAFLERAIGLNAPPAVTHPEFYYGFVAVTIVWQLAFLVIGRDPVRFRPLIPIAVLEKAFYVIAIAVLLTGGRIPVSAAIPALGDFVLGALFIIAYARTHHIPLQVTHTASAGVIPTE